MGHSILSGTDWITTLESHVIYESRPAFLTITTGGVTMALHSSLHNGRVAYPHFEGLVAFFTGLSRNSQSAKSDLIDWEGQGYEVKSFLDHEDYPKDAAEYFHTAASCCASANNHGPKIKSLLDAGDREGALAICFDKGYKKSRFFVYTNTGRYEEGTPFRFIIVPVEWVLENVAKDPRLISRKAIWASATRRVLLQP